MAKAKAKQSKASAAALSSSNGDIPKGMKALTSSFAATWQPEREGESLTGELGEVKTVTLQQGKKTVERRCVTVTPDKGDAVTVWESAMLKPLFEDVEEGDRVYIRYDGLGVAKKGQNAPKLFTVAVDG
jgi:hypothetical protein